MSDNLDSIRKKLDEIDRTILKALAQRQGQVKEVSDLKLKNDKGIRDLEREEPLYYSKLKENMIELDGEIKTLHVPNFTEAPWIHKKMGSITYPTLLDSQKKLLLQQVIISKVRIIFRIF